MTVSLPIARRATKCLVSGASAIYLCNEGAGTTVRDFSGNGYDGTLGAAAAAPTWGATGLTFDGGDWVSMGVAAGLEAVGASGSLSITIACVSTNLGAINSLIGKVRNGAANDWGLSILTDGKVYVNYRDASTSGSFLSAAGVAAANVPVELTMTISDAGSSLYVNGAWNAGKTAAGVRPSTAGDTFYIGRATNSASYNLIGAVYAAAVYPFALTAGQVAQNHAALQGIVAARGVTLA